MASQAKDHMFDPDPTRPIDDILATIAYAADFGVKQSTVTTAYTVVPIAALNVRLAMDADRTAQKIVNLTKALIGLTIVLLIFTVILAVRG